jgi:hypothetical protein
MASARLPSVALSPQVTTSGLELAQPRQRQLHLHAALAADQLVPLITHHVLHALQFGRGRSRG